MSAMDSRASTAGPHSPPTARRAFAWFAVGSALAIVVAVVGGAFALRSVAIDEAKRDTEARALEAAGLIEAALADEILTGDPGAIGAVDDLALARVLDGSVVRVKLWSESGRVLYSDDPAQIGGTFPLREAQRRLLREGGVDVEVADLAQPENELDRGQGELLEAYTMVRTPSGTPVLFEIHERLDSVTADAARLLRALLAPLLGALLLIVLVQVPLVWSLTRRLQRGHEEREALLAAAIDASGRERRRVASYLHDGAVQDIAGVAFGLAPLADRAATRGDVEDAVELRVATDRLRHTVRDLRALLVELHPPHLVASGLEAALSDLASPLEARGVAVTLAVDGAERLDSPGQALVYRVAQEAMRNVIAYAEARSVVVDLRPDGAVARLVVRDDGCGFDPRERELRRAEGHLGLSLLEELVRQAGGALHVESAPGQGTTVALEVPLS